MGRRESRGEKEMINEIGFEEGMLLLYEAAMRAEREISEDSSNGYYRRRV